MRFDFTIRWPGGERDVAVLTDTATTFAAIRQQLLAAVGVPAGQALTSSGGSLDDDAALGSPALRNGIVLSTAPLARPADAGALSLQVIGGPDAGRSSPLRRGTTRVGRTSDCDVVVDDDRISRVHVTFEVGAGAVLVRDHGSTNGTFVDEQRVGPGAVALGLEQIVRIGDTLLVVRVPDGGAAASTTPAGDGLLVIRSPRHDAVLDHSVIVVPELPAAAAPRSTQWIAALLPAAAAGALSWFTHSPAFLLFSLLSPLMLITSSLGDRLHWRRSRRQRARHHRAELTRVQQSTTRRLQAEAAARRSRSPDPGTVAAIAGGPTQRIWERPRDGADQLCLRLGTTDLDSTLRARTGSFTGPAGTLHAVPLDVDLRDGGLGIVGPDDLVAGVVRWLVAQLAVLHSPTDVQLALFLSSPEQTRRWAWARWLPHLGHRVALTPDEWRALAGELAARHAPPSGGDTARRPTGWTVAVIDRATRLASAADLARLVRGASPGFTAICVDVDVAALPTGCAAVAVVTGETGARLTLRRPGAPPVEALVHRVDARWADQLARDLAPLRDAGDSTTGPLPASCHLLDLLGVDDPGLDDVLRRWASSDGRPSVPIGMTGEGPLCLDLAREGPHALVAGTTGAGKSELLRSLVLGLALAHPPDEVTFVLVDYKGGAAFAKCAGLPHVAGSVTDLDPHLTRRALRTLEAELRRRERLFAAAAVADLDSYRAGPRTELVARLIIVVDEFATLADELPEFVRGLVSVAQRGRSLGVHLVLATQRPGTAVTPEIRANAALRIALRTVDPAESREVVDAPDAALLPRIPGRAVLRTGSSLVGFQTATVDASVRHRSSGPRVEPLDEWRRTTARRSDQADGLTTVRLVNAVREAARRDRRPVARSPWCDPLPAQLAATTLPGGAGPPPRHRVPIGLLDRPDEQTQLPVGVDLRVPSSWLIVGGVRSGRTTALASLGLGAAAALGPDELEIYVVDGDGALTGILAPLPHVGAVLGRGDDLAVQALARRLGVRAASTDSRPLPPALLLVDDADRLHGNGALDVTGVAGPLAPLVGPLIRQAPGAGLTVAVAGTRKLLAPRWSGGFEHRLLLGLPDPVDYGLAGIPVRDVPASMPAGRALRAPDGAEIQIAFRGEGPGAGAAAAFAHTLCGRWSGVPPAPTSVRIAPLPERVIRDDLPTAGDRLRLGVAGDGACPVAIDPFDGERRWIVAGPARSGRTTTLITLLIEAARTGLPVRVAAPRRSALSARARALGVTLASPGDPAELLGALPSASTLVLVDDVETFADTEVGERLCEWARDERAPTAMLVSGRCDELATSYRGLGAELRRRRCGLLLRPGPVDGELFGVRLPSSTTAPAGRGFVIGEPTWMPTDASAEPAVPIQVAVP